MGVFIIAGVSVAVAADLKGGKEIAQHELGVVGHHDGHGDRRDVRLDAGTGLRPADDRGYGAEHVLHVCPRVQLATHGPFDYIAHRPTAAVAKTRPDLFDEDSVRLGELDVQRHVDCTDTWIQGDGEAPSPSGSLVRTSRCWSGVTSTAATMSGVVTLS